MVRRRPVPHLVVTVVAALIAWHVAGDRAAAQQPAVEFVPSDEAPEDYPEGAGREETFYACTACHGFKLVAQQGQSRRQWDETLDFMTKTHNMPAIEGKDREVVLDYLASKFPQRPPAARGWQNPFLNR
jgi:mono/diheme cytochrome c family protein